MLYEYKCSSCEQEFLIEHSIKDEARTVCPECGEETLFRLISGGGEFILKGSGWYRDGYSSTPVTEKLKDVK